MSDAGNAKPGAGTPGFARRLWRAVALSNYLVGLAGASDCCPLWPVAVDGARSVLALFWGGLR